MYMCVFVALPSGHIGSSYSLASVGQDLLVSGGEDGVKVWQWNSLLGSSEVSLRAVFDGLGGVVRGMLCSVLCCYGTLGRNHKQVP